MSQQSSCALRAVLALLLCLACSRQAGAAGFQLLQVPDPNGPPMPLGVWYPSDAPVREAALGPYIQEVTLDAPVRGNGLPLVLLSHGTGGTLASHHDSALALAGAGYIVAAPTHPGDSIDDMSATGHLASLPERPRHLALALEYLLGIWSERSRIDRDRIGAFGHGTGGFAVLIIAGGTPDLNRVGRHCTLQPSDGACRNLRGDPPASAPAWPRLPRLRALVVAAPTYGHLFVPSGLTEVTLPVQLWRPTFDEVLMHPWHAEQVRYALPNAPLYAEVAGASHYAFVAPCPGPMTARLPETCLDPPGFDRARFHRELNTALISFFNTAMR